MLRIHFLQHWFNLSDLGERLFVLIGHLSENGIKVTKGTIVDATIINAPTSTKNSEKTRGH